MISSVIILSLLQINLINTQIYQNDIPDFFYNVNFAGPIFDQSLYTITASNFSISSRIYTTVFKFYIQPQTDFTRPSFVPRASKYTPEDFTIISDNNNFIVESQGNNSYALLTNTSPLNYFEPYHRYVFNLIATQKFANRPPVSSTALVQINLVNSNVNAPIFLPSNQIFSISESASIGTVIGTVYATDADNDSIIYSTPSTQFYIDSTTGVITLQQVFSSTPDLQYFVLIIASDDGSSCYPTQSLCPRYSTPINITINILVENTNTPLFLDNICGQTVTLYENENGTNITTIKVFDDDVGRNGQITISFVSEVSYLQFKLLQTDQINSLRIAYLQSNTAFDYDTTTVRSWYLYILATDNGIPQRQAVCGLRINLLDVNDNRPIFASNFWNYTIYRSTYLNTSNPNFLRIIASDADSGVNAQIEYFIGTISVPYFTINQTTGIITLRPTTTISSLQLNMFPITFQIYALDRGSPRLLSPVNATVIIYFNNNTIQPATWYNPIYGELNIQIWEKSYELYKNRSIFSTDNTFNGSIYYTTSSSQTAIMSVYSPFSGTNIPFTAASTINNGGIFSSGILVTNGLHAEIQSQYIIYNTVLVQPPLLGVITVNLIDQNDQIPTFDIRSLTISIIKSRSIPQEIIKIQAIDRDVDYPNNYVRYRLNTGLTNAAALSQFYITPNGSLWTNSTFTSTNQTFYQLIITAYDGAPPWDSSTNQNYTQDLQLTVLITSLTSSSPVFTNSSNIYKTINETTANGTELLTFTIIDPDIDTILNCGISNGNFKNVFAFYFISDNSANDSRIQYEAIAKLYLVGPLDYDTKSNYTLVLFATDAENLVNLTVFINLQAQNTKAPYFNLMPGFNGYIYNVTENTSISILDGPIIQVIDLDLSSTSFTFDIIINNYQSNLNSVHLNKSGNNLVTIGIYSPGLTRDLPFGSSQYNFSIQVTDENGAGVSTSVPVIIYVNDINNNGPIPTNGPWYLTENTINPSTIIEFTDFDDPKLNNTLPFYIRSISPTDFTIDPTISDNGTFRLTYIGGSLNRSITKNLSITFNVTDGKGYPAVTTIPIIVADVLSATPISDASKTINVIYVNGYINSLRNVPLGSIYVNDVDDWFRANRIYSIRDVSSGLTFNTTNGLLSTSNLLYPGTSTIRVNVLKPIASSSALSTIYLTVSSIDREYIRKAATIRIQGEYPETLIDPSLGNRLNTLINALGSILSVSTNSITILTIRSVYQYRSPYYPPLSYDQAKQQALTDIVFYISSLEKESIENTLNTNLALFSSQFGITANTSGPNPCINYACPTGTICRATRTIQPLPTMIDSNQTSFVGINILDSPDCVNATYALYNSTISTILGRTFNGNGDSYAIFNGTQFSILAPTRFSFDFVSQSPLTDGLILLYGRNTVPIDDFFWIAVELYKSRLRFHFRELIFNTSDLILNASTWYHVEYQYVSTTILLSINDYQYFLTVNNTLNTYDLSNVHLYLGGFPTTGSIISGLYPSLTQINTFTGCIRNLLSNGYYIDMNSAITSVNSNAEQCSCNLTNSCTVNISQQIPAVIVPWYTWLIIVLVFLLLGTIILLIFLACIRKKEQQKATTELYPDDTRDSIIVYRDAAGEEDHSMYNLEILKKPVYTITDEEILVNNRRRGSRYNTDYADVIVSDRPSLADFIDEKLTEQKNYPLANDTQLHYRYEGEGSITSDLSAIESDQDEYEDPFEFLSSNVPKHSQFNDYYTDDII